MEDHCPYFFTTGISRIKNLRWFSTIDFLWQVLPGSCSEHKLENSLARDNSQSSKQITTCHKVLMSWVNRTSGGWGREYKENSYISWEIANGMNVFFPWPHFQFGMEGRAENKKSAQICFWAEKSLWGCQNDKFRWASDRTLSQFGLLILDRFRAREDNVTSTAWFLDPGFKALDHWVIWLFHCRVIRDIHLGCFPTRVRQCGQYVM